MAIDLDTDPGGLFVRLGRIGKLILLVDQHQGALPAALESLFVQYDSLTPPGLRDVIAPTVAIRERAILNQGAWLPVLQQAALGTLYRMVLGDVPSAAVSVEAQLKELIRQMVASSDSVKRSTVSVTATAGVTVGGTGAVVTSATNVDGLPLELMYPETGRFECTADSQFTYTGPPASIDPLAYDWPAGSGAVAGYAVATPDANTVITDGDLELWAGSPLALTAWTLTVGTAGTHLIQDDTVFYDGLYSAKLPGSASLTDFSQEVGSDLQPLTAYAVAVWVRVSGVPAAGVLTVDLASGGSNLADQAGTANTLAVSLPGLSAATWTVKTVVFRTPRILPSNTRLRLRITTALSAGTDLNIDRVVMTPMAQPYAGGPFLAAIDGATPFSVGDYWNVAAANNRGGASDNATFQALFDRLFSMSELGLALPSSASPTLADTLITA